MRIVKHIDIWSLREKSFDKLPLSWLFIFWEDWGKRLFLPFDSFERKWVLSDFTLEWSFWKILPFLSKEETYFVQPVSPYPFELTIKDIFTDIVVKWKMSYWWENTKLDYWKYRWYDSEPVVNWRKTLLFYKKLSDINKNSYELFYNSYNISWSSSLSWMIVDFKKNIVCSYYDYWINIFFKEWWYAFDNIKKIVGIIE